jgi:hypothetical protein
MQLQTIPRRAAARSATKRRLLAALAGCALAAVVAGARAQSGGCEAATGVLACQNLGPFTASVLRVNVTHKDGVTAYQGVRTTVRFQNTSAQPLILAYKAGTGRVTDNNGLVYNWNRGSYDLTSVAGMGIVTRDSADPQFVLAPGESRDASFEGVLQYSSRRSVPGNVFNHDLTIVELNVVSGRQVRTVREHALSFANLSAGSGAASAIASGGTVAPGQAVAPAQLVDTAQKLIELFKKH